MNGEIAVTFATGHTSSVASTADIGEAFKCVGQQTKHLFGTKFSRVYRWIVEWKCTSSK